MFDKFRKTKFLGVLLAVVFITIAALPGNAYAQDYNAKPAVYADSVISRYGDLQIKAVNNNIKLTADTSITLTSTNGDFNLVIGDDITLYSAEDTIKFEASGMTIKSRLLMTIASQDSDVVVTAADIIHITASADSVDIDGADVAVNATDDVGVNAGDDIVITAADEVDIVATGDNIDIDATAGDVELDSGDDILATATDDIVLISTNNTDTLRITELGIELCGAVKLTEQDTVGFRTSGFTGLTVTTDSLIYWINGSPAVLDHIP